MTLLIAKFVVLVYINSKQEVFFSTDKTKDHN